MRKFPLFILLFVAFVFSESTDIRTKFLLLYYGGEFEKAHELIKQAFPDPTTAQVWEERIHLHKAIANCDYKKGSTSAIEAMALLRIGRIDEAKSKCKSDDWLSRYARATLAYWSADFNSARTEIEQALAIEPERPELLYFAGSIAQSPAEANAYFLKYLAVPSDDPLRRATAEFSIDFNKKTTGLNLNDISIGKSPQKIDSEFTEERLVMKMILNEKDKLNLMVDTGASGLTVQDKEWQPKISSELMMTGLGKSNVSKAKHAVFDVLSCNQVLVKNPVVAISPSFQSLGINGVVGTILFSNYLILLPLKQGMNVTLFLPDGNEPLKQLEQNGIRFSKVTVVPFRLIEKLILLKGRIKKGDHMDILLDTGAQQSILSAETAREYTRINFDYSARNRQSLIGLGGKTETPLIAENVEVQVGDLFREYQRMLALNLSEISEALGLELDLILGRDFLNGYTLLIDYQNSKVFFLK